MEKVRESAGPVNRSLSAHDRTILATQIGMICNCWKIPTHGREGNLLTSACRLDKLSELAARNEADADVREGLCGAQGRPIVSAGRKSGPEKSDDEAPEDDDWAPFLALTDMAPGKNGIGDMLEDLDAVVALLSQAEGGPHDITDELPKIGGLIERVVERIRARLQDVMDHWGPVIKAAQEQEERRRA